MNESTRWKQHNQMAGSLKLQPAQTLLKALEALEQNITGNELFCVDLGCGSGIDTLALLEKNWRVLAVDNDPEVIRELKEKIPPEYLTNFSATCSRFEELSIPSCLLLNATFSIPWCPPVAFAGLWQTIVSAIKPGGAFAGHFFGKKDSWATRPEIITHEKEELGLLFSHFNLHYFEETEKEGLTLSGMPKHWHVFHIAAIKHTDI